ncbi:FUSC family protein [Ornithinimicrobium avium]|uniref:Aromatic acid exporter family protein n=1 Tax=Ornithinimicrobium avium TaxID=2283195 RepID=A0A345NJ94_9MICO|nr:FUSC family protein [Ornithinimicrobium avium]AXH95102.1 aromatic acid exporter family protein [Ornithinimicrobium avium]
MTSGGRPGRYPGHRVLDPVRGHLAPGAFLARTLLLRARAWLIVQAALGAGVAWWAARDLLGHPLPFFAPVTAIVCLGLTYTSRLRRIAELTVGVAVGIFIGDLFVHTFGSGVWQIVAVVVVAMSLAVLVGGGQMLMMQAGIQGTILTTLVAGEGEALSRWLDAVVGGAVALVIAMLAPVRSTTERPRQRAVAIVGRVAEVLTDTVQSLRNRDRGRAAATLAHARGLSSQIEELRQATAEATAAARLAPLLSGVHREDVETIHELLGPLDLAVRNLRVLVRRAELAVEDDEFVPATYTDMVADLAQAAATIQDHLEHHTSLAGAQEDLVTLARRSTWSHPRAGLSAEVVRAQVRSTVVDLLVLAGMPLTEARRRVPATKEELDPTAPVEPEDPASGSG